jgi:hypothetical protein
MAKLTRRQIALDNRKDNSYRGVNYDIERNGEHRLDEAKAVPKSGVSTQREPLSLNAAQTIIQRAVSVGRIDFRTYINMRMAQREFTSLDVERVLRSGAVFDGPEYDIKHGNWKYKVRALIDGCALEMVVVIDADEDYDSRPLVIPVTGYWAGDGTRHGKRIDGWGQKAGHYRKATKKIRGD